MEPLNKGAMFSRLIRIRAEFFGMSNSFANSSSVQPFISMPYFRQKKSAKKGILGVDIIVLS